MGNGELEVLTLYLIFLALVFPNMGVILLQSLS